MQTVVRNSGHRREEAARGCDNWERPACPHPLSRERARDGRAVGCGWEGAAGRPGPRGADVRWTHRRPRRLRKGDRAQWPLQAG